MKVKKMESQLNMAVTVDDQKYLVAGVVTPNQHPCYKLTTVKQMFETVKPASLPYFLKDLEQVFQLYYQHPNELNINTLEWIDDQQSNMNINVTTEDGRDKQELIDLLNQHYVKL